MPGISVGEAFISIRPDTSRFAGEAQSGIGKPMGNIVKGIGALFAASKVKDWIGGAVSEATRAVQVERQTAAVIKSTGGAAGVSAKQVGDYADALARKTGIDDEQIQSGENMLLTFKNIGSELFGRTTKAVVDTAAGFAALHGTEVDVSGATIQIGKALNDPIKGLTALTRVGVDFTKGQKDQIRWMVAHGDVAGAQKIILKELESQFKGSAEAQATAGGKLQVAYGNLKETIGKALLPVISSIVSVVQPVVEWLTKHKDVAIVLAGIIGGILVTAIAAYTVSMISAAAATLVAAAPILAIIAVVGALVAGIVLLVTHWDVAWGAIKSAASAAGEFIVGVFNSVVTFFAGLPGKLLNIAKGIPGAIWAGIQAAAGLLWGALTGFVKTAVSFFLGLPGKLLDIGKQLVHGLWEGIKSAAGWLWDKLKGFASDVIGFIKDPLGIFSPSREMMKVGRYIVEGLALGIEGHTPRVRAAMAGLGGTVAFGHSAGLSFAASSTRGTTPAAAGGTNVVVDAAALHTASMLMIQAAKMFLAGNVSSYDAVTAARIG